MPKALPSPAVVKTNCWQLALSPPPAAVEMNVLAGKTPSLVVRCPRGRRAHVAKWVAGLGARRVRIARQHADVLVAFFDRWPAHWATWCIAPLLRIKLQASGRATLTMATGGDATDLRAAFVAKPPSAVGDPDGLTARQRLVLHAALDAGYYDIPRPVHLRELAAGLGMSRGAFAETLRRAEGRVVAAALGRFA